MRLTKRDTMFEYGFYESNILIEWLLEKVTMKVSYSAIFEWIQKKHSFFSQLYLFVQFTVSNILFSSVPSMHVSLICWHIIIYSEHFQLSVFECIVWNPFIY